MPKFKDILYLHFEVDPTTPNGLDKYRMEEIVLIVVSAVSLLQVTGTCEGFNLHVDSQRIECQNLGTYLHFEVDPTTPNGLDTEWRTSCSLLSLQFHFCKYVALI
jgi:hypothetical protein